LFDQPLSEIENFPAAGRAALGRLNLTSTARVWAALSQDDQLVTNLGLGAVDTAELQSALAAQARRESRSITSNLIARHLADFLVVLAIFALGLTFYLVHRHSTKPPDKMVVSAAKPIAPFHVIGATDLDVRPAADPKAVKDAASAYIGRYPTAEMLAGDKLNAAQLSSGRRLAQELDGLRIFSVKLRPTALLAGVRPPVQLNLFLSPHNLNDRAWSREFTVYLLDVKPQGDSMAAVIAAGTDISTNLISTQLAGDLIAVGPIQ
jgi:hypothetical protein